MCGDGFPFVVGLSGYAQVGKDTLAAFILERYDAAKVAFADELRDTIEIINPLIDFGHPRPPSPIRKLLERYSWDDLKHLPEVRRLMQVVGTEIFRERVSPGYWIDRWRSRVLQTGKQIVVASDVCFGNEGDVCDVVFRILRPGYEPLNGHASEHQAVQAHHVLVNEGVPADLADQLWRILDNHYCLRQRAEAV
jgi:hypothetical protein